MWIGTKIGFFEFNVNYGNIKVTARTLEELEGFAKIAGEALGREVKVFHGARTTPLFSEEPRFPDDRKVILEASELGVVLNLFAYTVDYHDFLAALKESEFLDDAYASVFSHCYYFHWIRDRREQALCRLKEIRLRKNKLEHEKQKLKNEIVRTHLDGFALIQKRAEAKKSLEKLEGKLGAIDAQKIGTPDNGQGVFEGFWKSIFGGGRS